MKFAIPTAEGKLATHFGHCRNFAMLSVNAGADPVVQRTDIEPPPHQPGLLPVWLKEQEVTHVIAGGLGGKAKEMLEERGIHVLIGAPSLEPEELVKLYLDNRLELSGNACDH
ncbi:MAG TPA: NifB/NifX family molybdenum-iron cluster-binding protein [Fibrobacteraceae bacterium]|nr:NifB/NifX family molybdenum-iron cluster-binding protein [Fibrobacteraceae bacterium]